MKKQSNAATYSVFFALGFIVAMLLSELNCNTPGDRFYDLTLTWNQPQKTFVAKNKLDSLHHDRNFLTFHKTLQNVEFRFYTVDTLREIYGSVYFVAGCEKMHEFLSVLKEDLTRQFGVGRRVYDEDFHVMTWHTDKSLFTLSWKDWTINLKLEAAK